MVRAEPSLTAPPPKPDLSDLCVGDWLVQPRLGRFVRGDVAVRVRPQLMDLLLCLAQRSGQTVSRDEIFKVVWQGQFVADSALSRCVAELRGALGDSPTDVRFIETIPKRGYRLIAPVSAAPSPPVPAVAPQAETTVPAPDEAAEAATEEGVSPAQAPGLREPAGTALRAAIRRYPALFALSAAVLAGLGYLAWILRPPGALDKSSAVVVAVENASGEAVFDATLPVALALQLEQSPYLRVVSEERVREELRFMDRRPAQALTREVARDVCRRVGAKAVIAGSLAKIGSHYVIGLEGSNCETGEILVRQQVEVSGAQEVVSGMGRAASGVRRRLGESITSIKRTDVPIAQATTGSLEALREFSLAERARGRGDDGEALRLYRRAVEIDPLFALARARLGVQLLSLSFQGEALAEFERAWTARDRVSVGEALSISAYHASWVARDPAGALSPLEAWRDAYPDNAVARLSLAQMYAQAGRLEQAGVEAADAVRLEPENALALGVQAEVLFRLGRTKEAREIADRVAARGRDNVQVRGLLVDIAFVEDNLDAMRRHIEWGAVTPAAAVEFLRRQGDMAWFEGKAAAGAGFWRRAASRAEERGDALVPAQFLANEAVNRALLGWPGQVAPLVRAALERVRAPQVIASAALALALAGDSDGAARLLADYARQPHVGVDSDRALRAAARAVIELNRRDPAAAVEELAPLRPYDLASRFEFLPAYIRGLAFIQSGRLPDAAAEFGRIVQHRTVAPAGIAHPLAWLQSARIRRLAGDAAGAARAYDVLLALWREADPELPVLRTARQERASLTPEPTSTNRGRR